MEIEAIKSSSFLLLLKKNNKNLIWEIQDKFILLCNNQWVIKLINNHVFYAKIKHIKMHHNFIKINRQFKKHNFALHTYKITTCRYFYKSIASK